MLAEVGEGVRRRWPWWTLIVVQFDCTKLKANAADGLQTSPGSSWKPVTIRILEALIDAEFGEWSLTSGTA